jgi:hypothetical protein
MLSEEIEKAQRLVKTDAYQMSIVEIVSMYDDGEIVIDPEFQRLFRWNVSQKSRLIESLLLAIPLPPIFVFEKEDGIWELIDGLQRISTILEFMGRLRHPDGGVNPPSVLEATKYLPSLHNAVWALSDLVINVDVDEQKPIDKSQQLSIRRSRLGIEILKRPSDDQTKYDLFQRLNAGGTQANAQELRNCIIIMINYHYFRALKSAAEQQAFQHVISVTDDQLERQRHMEMAVRFLVHARACRHSLEGEERGDEMEGGAEAGVGFVVAGGDPAEFLNFLEEVFDQVAPFVHFLVVGDGCGAAAVGRDHRQGAAVVELCPEPIAVEGFVADQRLDRDAVQQRLGADAVVALAGQQHEAREVAECVDQNHDLGGQAAARPADGLILSPPLRRCRAGGP